MVVGGSESLNLKRVAPVKIPPNKVLVPLNINFKTVPSKTQHYYVWHPVPHRAVLSRMWNIQTKLSLTTHTAGGRSGFGHCSREPGACQSVSCAACNSLMLGLRDPTRLTSTALEQANNRALDTGLCLLPCSIEELLELVPKGWGPQMIADNSFGSPH